jgi:hypothetical protein
MVEVVMIQLLRGQEKISYVEEQETIHSKGKVDQIILKGTKESIPFHTARRKKI